MTRGLVRYQQRGCLHFITFSCYGRLPYLGSAKARDLFENSLETMRGRYQFTVCGYVVMPEHVHLLVSEPPAVLLSRAIRALKLSVSVKSRQRPFWQARYYDFNVHSEAKRTEKLRYMHRDPSSEGWSPSQKTGRGRASATMHPGSTVRSRSILTGRISGVRIVCRNELKFGRADHGHIRSQISKSRPGAPG